MTSISRGHDLDGGGEDRDPVGGNRQPSSQCQSSKKQRGPTTCENLRKLWKANGYRPLPIEFEATSKTVTGRHVGDNASKLTTLVGSVIGESVLLRYSKWDKVPKTDKTLIWTEIKSISRKCDKWTKSYAAHREEKDVMKKSLAEYSSTSTPLSDYEILEKSLGIFHGHFPGIGRKLPGDGSSRVLFQPQSKMYTKEEVDRRVQKVVKRAEEAVGEVVETVNTKLSAVWGAFERANIVIPNYTPVTTPIIVIDSEDDENKEGEEDGANE